MSKDDASDLDTALRLALGVRENAPRPNAAFWQREHAARTAEALGYLRILLQLMGPEHERPAHLQGREIALEILSDFRPRKSGRPRDLRRTWERARAKYLRPKKAGRPRKHTAELDQFILAEFEPYRRCAFSRKGAAELLVEAELRGHKVSDRRRREMVREVVALVKGTKDRERARNRR